MMMVALSRVYGQQLPTARTLAADAEIASPRSFFSCSSCLSTAPLDFNPKPHASYGSYQCR